MSENLVTENQIAPAVEEPTKRLVRTLTRIATGVGGATVLGVAAGVTWPALPVVALVAAVAGGAMGFINPDSRKS